MMGHRLLTRSSHTLHNSRSSVLSNREDAPQGEGLSHGGMAEYE
jgi:hypothetical protein